MEFSKQDEWVGYGKGKSPLIPSRRRLYPRTLHISHHLYIILVVWLLTSFFILAVRAVRDSERGIVGMVYEMCMVGRQEGVIILGYRGRG